MSRITIEGTFRKTYHGVDRDAKHPDDFKAEVERKVTEALDQDGTEVRVHVEARDG